MGKFFGAIGYTETTEIDPGKWVNVITERKYYGDVIRDTRRLSESQTQPGGTLNDDIQINNLISIVADPFAEQNFHNIRYIMWMGSPWKVSNIEVQRPRLILTIGGIYNGELAKSPDPIDGVGG